MHRTAQAFGIFGLSLFAFTAGAQDAAPQGLAPLQGTWTVTAAEQGGKPFDVIKGGVLTITGQSFELRTASGNALDGTLQVQPAASPQQLDFLLSTGAHWEAIYVQNCDIFRLNYVEQGDGVKRPAVFATTADTQGTVIVMRKAQ